MLDHDDALAIATAAAGTRDVLQYLTLFGSRRNRIAPPCAWLELKLWGNNLLVDEYQLLTELLQVWHALASCPGYSVAENPGFWRRVLQKTHQAHTDHIDRALLSSRDACHAFPQLRLRIIECDPLHLSAGLVLVIEFFKKLFDLPGAELATPTPSSQLLAAMATLRPHMDIARFSRSTPVQLVFQLPRRPYRRRCVNDYSHNIAQLHEMLVAIQTKPQARIPTISPKPQYVLQSVRLVGIQNLSDAMCHEVTSLMEDPRLHGLSFPRVSVAMLHRASHETWRGFLSFLLRPTTGDLAPKPQLPQALTLKCSLPALKTGHLETFFQLLPFTQAIRALTLNGMGTSWQLWAWLGFALFHPNASTSPLRKLSFLRRTTCIEMSTLRLFVEAASLRMASADEFANVVKIYADELQTNGACSDEVGVLETLASVLEDTTRTSIRGAPITSVAIDLEVLAISLRDPYTEQPFDMTAWTLVLAMLSPTLQHIYVTPVYRHHFGIVGNVRVELASAAVVRLVCQCPQLISLSIPMQTWTESELSELLDTTRAMLQSLEVHAKPGDIDRVLDALTQAARSDAQYTLRHVSLVVHADFLQRDGRSWRLCEELLESAAKPSFCLEYLYVHMEMIEFPTNQMMYGDPIGETARRVKRSFDGELLPHARAAETSRQAVALLSVIMARGVDCACGSLDAMMVIAIMAFVRPRIRRHVGIDWFDRFYFFYTGIHTMDDVADAFGTAPDRDRGR